jgi:hypothetical protein
MPSTKFFKSTSYPPDPTNTHTKTSKQETKAWKDEYTKLYREKKKSSEDRGRLAKLEGLLRARFAFDPISDPTGIDWGGANREPGREYSGKKEVFERALDKNPKAKTTGSEIKQHTERFTDPSKQSVSQKESNSGATAVAWCTCGSGQKKRKIYRYTSSTDANVVKYEMGSPTEISEAELEKLNGVSGTVNSVLDLRNESGRRQYGYSNIKNILGVAMLSPEPNKKKISCDNHICRVARYLTR